MKRLPVLIVAIALAMMAVVAGCGRTPRYDGRLVAADSLMRSAPDSALAIVEDVCPDSLAAEGDRAYRDLLLTQARYRCYVTATGDSAINRALAYYRAHPGEREKLTRAHIYKGAVMEELDHPDSAMHYYKQAEATVDKADYFNLGYIKMRIASLYQSQFSTDNAAIVRFKKAICCFSQIRDTNYLISCYGDMGAVFGMRYPDSAELFLNKAIELAQLSKSPKYYTYKSKLAGLWYYRGNYQKSNQLAMDVFNHGKELSRESQFYYYAAASFVKLGKIDSAKYILFQTPEPVDAVDSMNQQHVIAEIAKYEKDFKSYDHNINQYSNTIIKIQDQSREKDLQSAESEYKRIQVAQQNRDLHNHNSLLWMFLGVMTLFSLLLLWRRHQMQSGFNLVQKEKNTIINELNEAIAELELKLESVASRDLTDAMEAVSAESEMPVETTHPSATEIVRWRLSAISELSDSIRFRIEDGNKAKTVVPLSGLLSLLHERNQFLKTELKDTFWENMRKSVNGEYNDIISFLERHYPVLNDRDLKLICLLCAKITPQIIMICMNYNNPKTPSNYRKKIIQKKMGLDLTFDEFLKKYLNGEFGE